MCVFQCRLNCTITHLGFRTRRVDCVNVVYFRFTHHLGRPHYLWDDCEMIMMMKGREKVKPGAAS